VNTLNLDECSKYNPLILDTLFQEVMLLPLLMIIRIGM